MKKLLTFGLIAAAILSLNSCNKSSNGELVGASSRGKWFEPTPSGMQFIRRGTFVMGSNDQDARSGNMTSKQASIEAFWMDETEITNSEYRQFVNWVRDSIALSMTFDVSDDYKAIDFDGNPTEPPVIDWERREDLWEDEDENIQSALESLYIPENERFFRKKEVDARKLFYEYAKVNYKEAARRSNSYNYETQSYQGSVMRDGQMVPVQDRSSFIVRSRTHVYPDTLVWIRDFSYGYNEPWTNKYFWHPGFDEYPVVGVTWKQAKAFCHWRTATLNKALIEEGGYAVQDYHLPTEAEWEYAARGGVQLSMFPWGGYYARDAEGTFLANFKPLRGNYVEDGGMATMKVGSYDPNDYGLYDMAGNVAEWTGDAYDESAYNFTNDFNPSYEYDAQADDPAALKRKVIRGGSWKDISHFLQSGTRSYEYQDSAKSYIGFRCARSSFGNELK
ncbi:gliding motility-associated lipoprotein [Prolixibacteraceae bacterium JC049]|nr:gliding motility-associated lipoprotein [Prolixibacteraceae bacterium JC049]